MVENENPFYTENDIKRQGTPMSEEDFQTALRIKSLDGCFIPEDIQKRWGMRIDRLKGKVVFDPVPHAQSDSN